MQGEGDDSGTYVVCELLREMVPQPPEKIPQQQQSLSAFSANFDIAPFEPNNTPGHGIDFSVSLNSLEMQFYFQLTSRLVLESQVS
jgi:hypothetical protein